VTPARNCIPRWVQEESTPHQPPARSSSSVHPHARTPSALTAADRCRTAMSHACRAPCARAGRCRPSGAHRRVHGCVGAHPSRWSANRIEVWSASSVSVSAALHGGDAQSRSRCARPGPGANVARFKGRARVGRAALDSSMAASGAVGSACRGTRTAAFLRCHSQRIPSQ
jgi:hypothetical protein